MGAAEAAEAKKRSDIKRCAGIGSGDMMNSFARSEAEGIEEDVVWLRGSLVVEVGAVLSDRGLVRRTSILVRF
jgi:hypothetical protein